MMETTAQRKARRKRERFAKQFHSDAFVRFVHSRPCAITGLLSGNFQTTIQCAHVGKSRGAGGTWKDVIPLGRAAHHDFDTLSDVQFYTKRRITKQSVIEMLPYYRQLYMDAGFYGEDVP